MIPVLPPKKVFCVSWWCYHRVLFQGAIDRFKPNFVVDYTNFTIAIAEFVSDFKKIKSDFYKMLNHFY